MALGRDLLFAFLESQYKLNKEDPSFLIPDILLTDKLKRMRQGDRSRWGFHSALAFQTLETWKASTESHPRFVVGGWRR